MFKTYCRALVESFYNPRVYRDAITKWQGFGGVYMILLAAVLAAMLFITFAVAINTFGKTELQHIAEQTPTLTIENGLISVEGPQPVTITNSTDTMTITIDTTKSESELRETGAQIGVGETFIFVNVRGDYEVFYTDKIKDTNIKINKNVVLNLWEQNVPTIKTVAYPLLWIGQYLNLVVTCVLLAFLSFFLTTFMKEEFTFIERMRLCVLALTPATIISTFLKIAINHQTAPWFALLLAMLYLYAMLMLWRKLPPEEGTIAA